MAERNGSDQRGTRHGDERRMERSGETGGAHAARRPPDGVNGSVVAPPAAPRAPLLSAAERRSHERVLWSTHAEPTLVEVEEPGSDWRPVPCTVVDLAAGGIGLLAEEQIAPGSRVRVTFPLPPQVEDGDAAMIDLDPLIALGEVVHHRPAEPAAHPHVPPAHRRPHHHGVRFHGLDAPAEVRLLRALYGALPDGWAVERYTHSGAGGEGGTVHYAVVRGGKRVAQGFASYDRARARAMSMYLDEQAAATRPRRAPQSA